MIKCRNLKNAHVKVLLRPYDTVTHTTTDIVYDVTPLQRTSPTRWRQQQYCRWYYNDFIVAPWTEPPWGRHCKTPTAVTTGRQASRWTERQPQPGEAYRGDDRDCTSRFRSSLVEFCGVELYAIHTVLYIRGNCVFRSRCQWSHSIAIVVLTCSVDLRIIRLRKCANFNAFYHAYGQLLWFCLRDSIVVVAVL